MKRFLPPKNDLLASLVVFIVAIPLSLGIAMASGAPAAAGLIAGILGGLVAGSLAGAPLTVTGPAAGLSTIVFQIVQDHGLAGLAVITVLAGLIQVSLGLAKAGKFVMLVPKPVLEGMLSAIGFLIFLGQLHVLFGRPVPPSLLAGLTTLPDAGRSLASESHILPVLGCGLLALAIQLIWPRIFRRLAWLPAALPAVVIATLVSLAWEMPRVTLSPLLPVMAEQGSLFLSFSWLSGLAVYLPAAVGLAVVASAESLLSARAIDSLAAAKHPGTKPCDLDRELLAQGVTNSLSGALGGLPCTGVIVRSAVNLNAGATSRWSTLLHGVWIAGFVGLLPFILNQIPLTALASVLILTGFKLLNLPLLVKELQHDRKGALIWMGTSLMILSTDLLKGLVISLVAVAAMKAWERYRQERKLLQSELHL